MALSPTLIPNPGLQVALSEVTSWLSGGGVESRVLSVYGGLGAPSLRTLDAAVHLPGLLPQERARGAPPRIFQANRMITGGLPCLEKLLLVHEVAKRTTPWAKCAKIAGSGGAVLR